jgi:hypothetical protein
VLDHSVFDVDGFQNSLVEATTHFRVGLEVRGVAATRKSNGEREYFLSLLEVRLCGGEFGLGFLLCLGYPILISFE